MSKTLSNWNKNHPTLQANEAAQKLKERLRKMSKGELQEVADSMLGMDAPKGRGNIVNALMDMCRDNFKLAYAKRNCFAEFAKWKKLSNDSMLSTYNTILNTPLFRTYKAWRSNKELELKNEIIQVLPHNAEVIAGYQCPHDTDGDGDCHICHKEANCREVPSHQRESSWRVFSDPEDNLYLEYGGAFARALELQEEGIIKKAV